MIRKCFISHKGEDKVYKEEIQKLPGIDIIDKSLNELIDSHDEDYIMQKIREDNLSDSTVTIHLIGLWGAEDRGSEEQKYIKRELQASLYNGKNNTRNGILGIVLPSAYKGIYGGSYYCQSCQSTASIVNLNDSTTIKEFHNNYYIPPEKCHHTEEDRYCVLTNWDEFAKDPNLHIEKAFLKRSEPIAEKITVFP